MKWICSLKRSFDSHCGEGYGKDTGARALRAIIEKFMLDIMYEIPKDDNIGRVTITEDYIRNNGAPLIEMRPYLQLEQKKREIAAAEEQKEN